MQCLVAAGLCACRPLIKAARDDCRHGNRCIITAASPGGASMSAGLTKKLIAEAIGVFTLCFAGVMAITHGGLAAGASSLATVAFAHGLAIAVMVAALGWVSGAHFNPAVTFAFWLTKRISAANALAYIIAQLAGGFLAGLLLVLLFGADGVASGTPALATGVSPLAG